MLQSYDAISPGQPEKYRTYRRRWYVLILYVLLGTSINVISTTLTPITPIAVSALNLSQTDISFSSNWFNIMFLISIWPNMYLLQTKGLRMPCVLGSLFLACGSWIRCLNSNGTDPRFDKFTLHLGQAVNGLGSSIFWFSCTRLTALWFPPSERSLSTTIGLLSGSLGVALSFLIGPLVVDSVASTLATEQGGPMELYYAQAIRQLFYGEAICCAILCTLTIIYFPSKPPTPPCYSASAERLDIIAGIYHLARNSDAWVMLLLCAISSSVLTAWSLFLSVTVEGVMSNTEAGWLGFTMTVISLISGPIATLSSKWWIEKYPKIVCSLVVAVGALLTVVFLIGKIFFPQIVTSSFCWSTLVIASFFITSCQPLWWEMTCEAVYPVPEQVISGFFAVGFTLVSVTFLILYSIPTLGTLWINWCLAICEVFCIPLIFFYSGIRRRSADDQYHPI